jgi:hypothetical protein
MTIEKLMATPLTDLVARIAASVTNKQTGANWTGHIDFGFGRCTVADLVQWAMADRKITWANANRKRIAEYVGRDVITVALAPVGTRERVARVITESDVETFMSGLTDEQIADLVKRARE